MASHGRKGRSTTAYVDPGDGLYVEMQRDEYTAPDGGHVDRQSLLMISGLRQPGTAKRSPVSEDVKRMIGYRALELAESGAAILLAGALPVIWNDHVLPLYRSLKRAVQARRLKGTVVDVRAELTGESEYDAVYHWISLLNSLEGAAGSDKDSIVGQLTDADMLEYVNTCLGGNPKLLDMEDYLALRSLLGRDLYNDKEYVPLEAEEIRRIAAKRKSDTDEDD